MKLYVGVTDNNWFDFLSRITPDEVNFWRPGGTRTFKAIPPGAPFLFKLHSPLNFIAGGGFFVKYSVLPLSLAWKAFGEKNGAADISSLRRLVLKHRRDNFYDPVIGCTILTNPFFLTRDKWIPVPNDWSMNIVSGKSYRGGDEAFQELWEFATGACHFQGLYDGSDLGIGEEQRWGSEYLARARLGQGAFRVLVTDAYSRQCAMTGERVLPVLEAAHIKSFAEHGPNATSNGLLLRSDLHNLFDSGYITISPDYHIEVSKRIREEFHNGRIYYALHGQRLPVLPESLEDRPGLEYIDWHNSNVFVG